MKIKINEAFRSMAGSPDYHNEEGVLQEAPENIIPPAFNRLVDYAKLGDIVSSSPEATKDRIAKDGLPKGAQDTFAQYIVRYAGRSHFNRSTGQGGDFALNPYAITNVFFRAFRAIPDDVWDDTLSKAQERYKKRNLDDSRVKLNNWIEESFNPSSRTPIDWLSRARKMAADGATGQQLLVYLGKQYKSYMKNIKKYFTKNPEWQPAEKKVMEYVNRQWNWWQLSLIEHAHNNFRKISLFMKDNPDGYKQLNALIKKYPSRNEYGPPEEGGDLIERDSLYHTNELIDKELLKKQLDACKGGWSTLDMGNAKDPNDMSAPCVVHEYEDGFFWWNRKASKCDIAGEEMANCGSSNFENSTLVILKQRVSNDSMEVMDKLKGRIMVEYNSNDGTMEQILGFANSFPEEKYWKYIKDFHDKVNVQDISKYAFQHLEQRGDVDQEQVDKFLSFVSGQDKLSAPKDFYKNDNGTGFMNRISDKQYDLDTEANFGGRQTLSFKSDHREGGAKEGTWQRKKAYAPINVELYIRPLPYPEAPETLSTDEHPSIEKMFFDNIDESMEKTKQNFGELLGTSLRYGLRGIEPIAGSYNDSMEKMIKSFKFIRIGENVDTIKRKLKRRAAGVTGASVKYLKLDLAIKASFQIPAEFFTEEDLRDDVPMPEAAHAVVMRVRRVLGGEKALVILNNSIRAVQGGAMQGRGEHFLYDDGPDDEERNWRPGMPTPGLRPTDYQDQELQPNPGAEQVGDATDLLLNRGNMLLRLYGERPERINDSVLQIFRRFKSQMEEQGIWDQWWNNVDDNHPLKRLPLEEDRIMVEARAIVDKILGEKKSGVEAAHMNENNDIRKGGILPFKKEEGEFYFLLGQAPQGWWSDFRGGEEAKDGGDLKVTAAREFAEESSFDLPVTLDDAFRIEHKNAAVYLADLAELDPEDFDINKVMKINKGDLAGTPEIVAVKWYHINKLPHIPRSRMPIIQKAIDMLTAPEPDVRGMETSGGDAYTPFLNESEGVEVLHIFDFDDTIAFTTSYTQVSVPEGEVEAAQLLSKLDQEPPGPPYALDQHGLDQMFRKIGSEEELESRGFDLDFSSFKSVPSSSPLNPVIARRINDCCLAGGRDPNGDFYVLTARSAAAEDSIHQYLSDNKIDIDRSKVIGVEGKSKGDRIKSILRGSDVKKVIFYDDSDNNIDDVARLREDPDLKNVTFELYPVDKEGNIPKKPMQETIYERKRFKFRIGAK